MIDAAVVQQAWTQMVRYVVSQLIWTSARAGVCGCRLWQVGRMGQLQFRI